MLQNNAFLCLFSFSDALEFSGLVQWSRRLTEGAQYDS